MILALAVHTRVLLVRVHNSLSQFPSRLHLCRHVCLEFAVELRVVDLHVCRHASIREREIVVFLLIHLLVQDILLTHAKSVTSALLVNLRSPTGRFEACLKASVATA